MKYLFTSSVIFLFSILCFGQCPSGEIALTTQEEVDQFIARYPHCTQLKSALYIDGENIADISGLATIKRIEGYLHIGNTSCAVIDLSFLAYIGNTFTLHKNKNLNKIYLDQLAYIGGDLFVNDNTSLVSVGLNMLGGSISNFHFQGNASLESIELCRLKEINGYFYLNGHESLRTLCLDNIAKINGYLYVGTSGMEQMEFPTLTTVNGSVTYYQNLALNSLKLDHLIHMNGDLYFFQNTSLPSLRLHRLEDRVVNVFFYQNTALRELELCGLPEIGGHLNINKNVSLAYVCFESLSYIPDYLRISASGLTDLSGFPHLKNIGGDLTLSKNKNMSEYNGICQVGIGGKIVVSENLAQHSCPGHGQTRVISSAIGDPENESRGFSYKSRSLVMR